MLNVKLLTEYLRGTKKIILLSVKQGTWAFGFGNRGIILQEKNSKYNMLKLYVFFHIYFNQGMIVENW